MDDVPEFDPFSPPGLPTNADLSARIRTMSRAELFESDGCTDEYITFALHTVDVRDGKALEMPLYDACNEEEMERHVARHQELLENKRTLESEERFEEGRGSSWLIEPDSCTAYLTGQTASGWKVGFVIPFQPFCEVELEDVKGVRDAFLQILPTLANSLRLAREHIKIHFHTGHRFKGFVPDPSNPLKRKTYLYARLSFPTQRLMENAAQRLREGLFHRGQRVFYPVYEDRIDVDQKFIDQFQLVPSGWHRIPKMALSLVSPSCRRLLVNDEYALANASSFELVESMTQVPPMVVVSVDAEMNGFKPDRFPKAHRKTDAVVVIGLVFAVAGGDNAAQEGVEFERQAYVLGRHCDPIDGVIIKLFDDELEMIAAVRDELFAVKMVDIVTGHNIVKFDMQYLATRIINAPRNHPCKRFLRFGALFSEKLKLREKRLSSAGMGANTLYLLFGVGFAYVDTMLLCKQYHKLRENTLKFASSVFLPDGMNKFDMPYNLIPDVANNSNAAHWRLLTAYCVQDCVLVVRLLKKWDSIKDLVAQSRVINIPLAVNVVCGQQQRVRDSLMKKARTMNMVMNGVNERREVVGENVSAEGGWVIDSVAGLHDFPVAVLDFASLYPSVQREHNLCWSTVIDDLSSITEEHRAAGLVVKSYATATGMYHIASNVPGVFPLQLKDLLMARRAYKKEMEAADYGSAAYQNADAKQKATKIVMNSGYGTANCEEGKGIMPCKAVGTITCFEGRKLNESAKSFVENDPRFKVRTLYGDTDSIMVAFPEEPLYERVMTEFGRLPTRKERLQYAIDKGFEAEHALNEEVFRSDVIKTECEKVYFPFRPCCKKTYAGLKFEPKDLKTATDDLDRPNKALGISGGSIEAKGMRTVRRDVPLFVREMSQKLLDALFFDRSIDKFWDIVHTYTEKVCHAEFPLEFFELTKELKDNYWNQETVAPHVAVSYAREYAHPGSGFVEGDRVGFVFVQQPDPQRVVKPPWLNSLTVPDESFKTKEPKETLDPKRSMCARHIDEVRETPDMNHIDVVYYVEKGICSVLDQLMPDEVDARKALMAYAQAAEQVYKRLRGPSAALKTFCSGAEARVYSRAEIDAMLPTLSHKKPATVAAAMQMSLCGGGAVAAPQAAAKRKPAAKKPAPSQFSLGGMFS